MAGVLQSWDGPLLWQQGGWPRPPPRYHPGSIWLWPSTGLGNKLSWTKRRARASGGGPGGRLGRCSLGDDGSAGICTELSLTPKSCLLCCPDNSVQGFWDPVPMRVWFSPHTPSNSLTPTGCPTIQLNSDITCLETGSAPTGYRLSPMRLPPLQKSSQTLVVTCASD